MKRELIFLIGLSSAMYATQDISCVDFVNMQKVDAKNYIDNYRREFELNHFKTKNHTYNDKQYIGMQGGVSKHLLTCLDLRRVTHYGVKDDRRALILTSLSTKKLSQEEQNIYQNSLNENINFYKKYTNSSLLNATYMPLVYLTIQRLKDKKYYFIYEFRKNGVEIKRYAKKILVSKPYIKFSDITSLSNQSYLNYIQKRYPTVKLYKVKKATKTTPQITNSSKNTLGMYPKEKYEVIKPFEGELYKGNEPDYFSKISTGAILTKIREDGKKIYFLDKYDNEYSVSKIRWKKSTKRVGGVE